MRRKNFFQILISCCLAVSFLIVGSSFVSANRVIYMYMCGSDLESNYQSASKNLAEIMKVPLPEDVKFVIQTGGAKKWHNKDIPNKNITRFVYDSTGLHEVGRLSKGDMGSSDTLRDFLSFCKENYPADKQMLIFWNHGGGSLIGVCFDELTNKILGLNEMQKALSEVYTKNENQPPFEMVAFDTCLMATLETANTLHGFTRYMAASEEVMPETGLNYEKWVGALAKNPNMDGAELGKIICDTFAESCNENGFGGRIMFSITDLAALPELNAAYEQMGKDLLAEAEKDPKHLFTALDRIANNVEHYGANDATFWFTDMIDIGMFANDLESVPGTNFVNALKKAVIYKVNGPYRGYGMGLSAYFSLDGTNDYFKLYRRLNAASGTFVNLYSKMLTPDADGNPPFHFDVSQIENVPVTFDENNFATVTLPPDAVNAISEAHFQLYIPQEDDFIALGIDAGLVADWDNGVFKDDFNGKWPALDGHLIPMILDEQRADYNTYFSPILLNGESYLLMSAWNVAREEFEILGAYYNSDKKKTESRLFVQLKEGDKITPLFPTLKNSKPFKGETFTVGKNPVLRDEVLADGIYAYVFEFITPRNDPVISDVVAFSVDNGNVTVEKD